MRATVSVNSEGSNESESLPVVPCLVETASPWLRQIFLQQQADVLEQGTYRRQELSLQATCAAIGRCLKCAKSIWTHSLPLGADPYKQISIVYENGDTEHV